MAHLGHGFGPEILERLWIPDREAADENVCLWIAQRAQPVVLGLPCEEKEEKEEEEEEEKKKKKKKKEVEEEEGEKKRRIKIV